MNIPFQNYACKGPKIWQILTEYQCNTQYRPYIQSLNHATELQYCKELNTLSNHAHNNSVALNRILITFLYLAESQVECHINMNKTISINNKNIFSDFTNTKFFKTQEQYLHKTINRKPL